MSRERRKKVLNMFYLIRAVIRAINCRAERGARLDSFEHLSAREYKCLRVKK